MCKDFTSLLAEAPDTRSGLLAALREVYDGWVRRLGTNGGRTVGWAGKAGLLAGVTETIDRHSAVMGAMGERFVSFRMPVLDDEGRLAQARTVLGNAGRQAEMRAAFAEGVAAFVAGLDVPASTPPLAEEMTERLVVLADLATRCRSAVERDPRDREVELVPQAEAPGRLQAVLAQLLRALAVVGVTDDEAGALVARVALDSMIKRRRAVVELLVGPRHRRCSRAARSATRWACRPVRSVGCSTTWPRTASLSDTVAGTATRTVGGRRRGCGTGGWRSACRPRRRGRSRSATARSRGEPGRA